MCLSSYNITWFIHHSRTMAIARTDCTQGQSQLSIFYPSSLPLILFNAYPTDLRIMWWAPHFGLTLASKATYFGRRNNLTRHATMPPSMNGFMSKHGLCSYSIIPISLSIHMSPTLCLLHIESDLLCVYNAFFPLTHKWLPVQILTAMTLAVSANVWPRLAKTKS